ncbi:cupin domain-containing protein [Pseudonocardia sp. C8]|uniref:cupin domain-containing protein n=1 Tax=Pseudonocardia sp. C8 TaxID=2762759 RepID=UPI0016434B68|nr:cupin domain-containing protein [Pseudonocardia sp. C8]MBC3192142.1 cupin domain-containing protein [Pseudonocardia sp. C8]
MTAGGGIVARRAGDGSLRVLLAAAHSDGALGAIELAMAPGSPGPPLHVHPTHGEGFYVLAGRPGLQVGDEVIVAEPGDWAFAPREVPHTLANHGSAEARLLCVFAPGGFERRFERILAETTGAPPPPGPSPEEEATRVLGPPLAPPS